MVILMKRSVNYIFYETLLILLLSNNIILAEVVFNDEKAGDDNIDFLIRSKGMSRAPDFKDKESDYVCKDYVSKLQ